jgi:penicillin amidase
VRPSTANAIYYLNPGYANGMRAGRITRLIEGELARDGEVSAHDMQRFQGNTQQLDAELLLPSLLGAYASASLPGAPPELAALASDAGVSEAVSRLAEWDFSTPTGIAAGWDARDVNGVRKSLAGAAGRAEIEASVAATLYNMWRGFAVRNVVDARLMGFGLGAGSTEALKALVHLLDDSTSPYTGVAAAGFDWIPEPAALPAAARRDLALLGSLRDALDQLASNALAPAFANSTDQGDYRWGKLHRIVFDHPFEDSFDIPPQGGFGDLAPGLRGLSRDGGYEVVNASGFSTRSISLDGFMFGGGPVRRYVGRAGADEIHGVNVVPGGPSGIPGDPGYATQLATWLTADYHPVKMSHAAAGGVPEIFLPAP